MDGLIHDDAIDPAWMEDEAEGVNRADNPPIIIIIDHRAEPRVLLLTINNQPSRLLLLFPKATSKLKLTMFTP